MSTLPAVDSLLSSMADQLRAHIKPAADHKILPRRCFEKASHRRDQRRSVAIDVVSKEYYEREDADGPHPVHCKQRARCFVA